MNEYPGFNKLTVLESFGRYQLNVERLSQKANHLVVFVSVRKTPKRKAAAKERGPRRRK